MVVKVRPFANKCYVKALQLTEVTVAKFNSGQPGADIFFNFQGVQARRLIMADGCMQAVEAGDQCIDILELTRSRWTLSGRAYHANAVLYHSTTAQQHSGGELSAAAARAAQRIAPHDLSLKSRHAARQSNSA